ncbi:uncharacterized protein LOC113302979 isoform X1 [Papaver somniferum]|uniref:uncharacterized protein LOC113302979 isoform X1 n=2 Tax=Papaver somniferum TaxID=3469 RepID=UPI000E705065|nr:uncharacterized protein LOC113302979 isoform X1 [Papaver somniferum]XP_026407740.1 uncharacterized protein LOC113302979 isoform X1 [Papaver somniferum]
MEADMDKDLENDNSSNNEEGGEGKEAKKRKYVPRGPTQMHAMKLDSIDPKKEVPFNTNEQPIGDHSAQLASVLGVLVRKLLSTFRDWRVVPSQAKENIWKIVTNRFIVPEYYKDYYFSKMGTYLREARSRKAGLVLEAFDQLQGEEREKRLDKLMPRTMTVREWEDFVKHVDSAEFIVKRLKMQQVRNKYTTPHSISRLGYAVMHDWRWHCKKKKEQLKILIELIYGKLVINRAKERNHILVF